MRYSRQRTCTDCGIVEAVRRDNTAERCARCSGRRNGAIGLVTIKARAKVGICEDCGGERRGVRKRFCSKGCLDAAQANARLKLTCQECGKGFERPPSIYGTNASGRFCSTPCYHKFMCRTDRVTTRGALWRRIRNEAIRRAPFCALCGTRKRLHVHHAMPFRLTADNSKGNLFPLCAKHHKVVEHMFVRTEQHGDDPPALRVVWVSILRQWQLATAMKIKQVLDEAHR